MGGRPKIRVKEGGDHGATDEMGPGNLFSTGTVAGERQHARGLPHRARGGLREAPVGLEKLTQVVGTGGYQLVGVAAFFGDGRRARPRHSEGARAFGEAEARQAVEAASSMRGSGAQLRPAVGRGCARAVGPTAAEEGSRGLLEGLGYTHPRRDVFRGQKQKGTWQSRALGPAAVPDSSSATRGRSSWHEVYREARGGAEPGWGGAREMTG